MAKTRFWNIEYRDGILDQDSPARRAVRRYIEDRPGPRLTQPEAIAEMLGYARLPSMKAENTRKSGTNNKQAA